METMDTTGLRPAMKGMSDSEVRLNCLDLAVRSFRLHGAGRPGLTPLALAEVYVAWVAEGITPAPPQGVNGVAQPAPLTPGFGHGEPPGANEMTGEAADDLTRDHPKAAPAGGPASLRQGGKK